MDRLCQYSTIIYSGNVCVLLIVAISTDYWEYRFFQQGLLNASIHASNTTRFVYPTDTNTYFLLRYFWDPARDKRGALVFPGTEAHYQPPALLYQYYTVRVVNVTHNANGGNVNVNVKTHGNGDVKTHGNGNVKTHGDVNVNVNGSVTVETRYVRHKYEDVIVVFQEYGNLFRDCDDLEVGVQKRLGLPRLREGRCRNFIMRMRDGFIARELPAVPHLERAAFVFAVACIVASVVSVAGGAYGSLAHERFPVVIASAAALVSGMSLTVSIALFHGKCHLLHRRPFMAGLDIPYKRHLNTARDHQYGWSFGLAWICVVLCFVHAWVWLLKAQDMPDRFKTHRRRVREGVNCSAGYDFSILS